MAIFVIFNENANDFAVNIRRQEIITQDERVELVEDKEIFHAAQTRRESDSELLERVGRGGFVLEVDELPAIFEANYETKTVIETMPVLTKYHVNAEISEVLGQIWGGTDQVRTALKHQNAVGVMGRLINKIVAEEAVLTADEEAIKDAIKAQLEAHEAVILEGRRIKALSPIPDNFKELLGAIQKP